MIYRFMCGCGAEVNVEASIPAFEWACPKCSSVWTTSVPTDAKGELAGKIGEGSIVALSVDEVEGEIVRSDPIGTSELAALEEVPDGE